METIRSKLEEATLDIVALRKQLQKRETHDDVSGIRKINNSSSYSNKDYEQLVQELEKILKKVLNMNESNFNDKVLEMSYENHGTS